MSRLVRGEVVRSKHEGWRARVLREMAKQRVVRVLWESGPLTGRDALVARESLVREHGANHDEP